MRKFTLKMWFIALVMAISTGAAVAQATDHLIDAQSISITAEFDVTPSHSSLDAAVGLKQDAIVDNGAPWSTLSSIIGFTADSTIRANNGNNDGSGSYVPVADFMYAKDSVYHIVINANIALATWSATIEDVDGTIYTVAEDYGFRGTAMYINNVFSYNNIQNNPDAELVITNIVTFGTKSSALGLVTELPSIDGDLSDGYWDNLETQFCESSIGAQVSNTTDLSGYWKAVWTADSLYVMANVVDGSPYANEIGAPTWNTDGVHFYFDLLNDRDSLGAGSNETDAKVFSQLYFTADGSSATGGNDLAPNHKIVANDSGYVVEVAYAWDAINTTGVDFTAENGALLMMDVDFVSYNPTNQWVPKELYWSSDQNCWSNMNNAGQIELAELDAEPLLAAIDSLQTQIDAAVVGQENGEYLQSVLDAAKAAIVDANVVLAEAKSQSELDNATANINNAITAFMPNNYPIATLKTVGDILPAIDGDLSDWELMDANENTVNIGGAVGESGFGGYWKAVWTADSLYIMADVTDADLHQNDANSWDGWFFDGVHIYFGFDNDRNGVGADLGGTKVFSQIYYTDSTPGLGGNAAPTNVMLTKTDSGYAIEASYSWATIQADFTPNAEAKILFDVDLVDYYAPYYPRELYWGSTQNCYSNMDRAGRMEFSNDVVMELDFSELEAGIASAQAAVDAQADNIGDEAGQYSQATVNAANTAILYAKSALINATTQDEIDQAVADLASAMELFVPNPVSVGEMLDAEFAMYPNPVNGMLMLDNISNVNSIAIYSVTGKLIITTNNTEVSTRLNLSELNSGIYIIKFNTDKGVAAKRIIKE